MEARRAVGAEGFYFGTVFGRPVDGPELWIAGNAEPSADLWATPDETREQIVSDHRRICAYSDATIEALPLDAIGRLPGAGGNELTLHRALVHMTYETSRHAGHADVVRELIDGTVRQRVGGHQHGSGQSELVGTTSRPGGAGRKRGRAPQLRCEQRPFRGAGNCATSHDGPAVNERPAPHRCSVTFPSATSNRRVT
ncbi:DUF664 domain-containing protein [Streptomyces sp. NPDC101455]|uniref:mycothiol transferase n=1 Tax=Streptomyces sp. NPDC101455 TaxID=3366142 RepID=UPI0038050BD5